VSRELAHSEVAVTGGTIIRRKPARRGQPTARFGLTGVLPIVSIVGFLVLWEITGSYLITQRIILVPVSEIVLDLWVWTSSGEIVPDLQASLLELVVGYGIAVVVGILIGLLIGLSRVVDAMLSPLVTGLYSIPALALTPLFIIWLGIGLWSKVALIFLVSVFPILMNTTAGIREVDRGHLDVVRSFGATWHQTVAKVSLPSAIPYIAAGLRLGVGRAVVAIFVAELFGARAGIGRAISIAASTFDTARLYSAILVLAALGIVAVALLGRVERLVAPWRARSPRSGL
jgi:ABC-type nitrate/sulfonate/bicarbonate transport system permease component